MKRKGPTYVRMLFPKGTEHFMCRIEFCKFNSKGQCGNVKHYEERLCSLSYQEDVQNQNRKE